MPTQEAVAPEQGFRSSLFGFDKNDVLACMKALASEKQRLNNEYQESLGQMQARVDKLTAEQNAARQCVDKLRQDLEEANNRAEEAEIKLAAIEEASQGQAGRFRSIQDDLNRSQMHCRDLEKEILRLQQELEGRKTAAADEAAAQRAAETQAAEAEMAEAGISPADPLADARREARRILTDARLYAQNAEKRLQQEADAQKQRMAEHAASISAGVLLLRSRLARVDDKISAATLDLENATAAIYEALDQADQDLDALGAHMHAFAAGHPETDPPPTPAAPPAPVPAARPRAAAQPAPPRRPRPARRPGRLRRTVSRDLQDAMGYFDDDK